MMSPFGKGPAIQIQLRESYQSACMFYGSVRRQFVIRA